MHPVPPSPVPSRAPGRVRNTRQAAVIEAELRGADGFRTAQQLFGRLRDRYPSIGLSTVYRYLNLLVEQRRADVIHTADGEAQFRLCGSANGSASGVADGVADGVAEHPGHHHHVVCRVCGRSVEVTGKVVETWAERVAAAAGYTDVTHTVEIFGRCPEHAEAAADAAARAG